MAVGVLHTYRVFTIPVYDGGRFIFANFNLFYSSENSVVMFATTVITNLYIYFLPISIQVVNT